MILISAYLSVELAGRLVCVHLRLGSTLELAKVHLRIVKRHWFARVLHGFFVANWLLWFLRFALLLAVVWR